MQLEQIKKTRSEVMKNETRNKLNKNNSNSKTAIYFCERKKKKINSMTNFSFTAELKSEVEKKMGQCKKIYDMRTTHIFVILFVFSIYHVSLREAIELNQIIV